MHLTPAHRELLRRRLHAQGLTEREEPRIVPRADGSDAPLSVQQRGIWLSEQVSPGRATYNVSMPVRLKGILQPQCLERALGEIVRRHEALRTVFVAGPDGQPWQRVLPPYPIVLTPRDVDPPGSANDGGGVEHRIRDEACRPFDLSRGPLLRAALFRVAADDHIVLLTLHHIICDGWSIGVLLREVAALYGAFVAGRPSPLPALAVQYGDYASWQETWLKRESLDEQLRYWREQLAGVPEVLDVPADRPRPAAPTGRGGRVTSHVGPSLATSLRELGRHEGATLFMTLLAGFQALLARYTGATDICVGTSTANRTRVEAEDLIGLFVNTPVLRTDLLGDPTFRELLRRVKAVALGAYVHQELPFERLVDELQPARLPGRHPLFQVHFTLQNAPRPPLDLPDLTLEPLDIDIGTTKFDLTLSITESPAGLAATLEYATDLFDAPTAARMLTQLETLLAAAVSAPDTPVAELPLIGGAERVALLQHAIGAATAQAPPAHVLVSRHARERPEALAVICGAERLTFAQLNAQANRLAHYLRGRGVGPECRVALAIERSPEMVVALLAVLKAGGVYLPLDPAHPAARQRSILAHAGVQLLLARSAAESPLDDTARVLALDEHASAVAAMPSHDPADTVVSPEQLAYILYTSGSTGEPKGVMVTHRGLANYLAWSMAAYAVTEGSGAPVQSPLTFDLTVTSLLMPLAAGRAIVLLPEEPDLQTLSTVRGMSLIKITPAHLQLLASVMPPEAVTHWTGTIVVGGEALTGETLRFFRQHAPALRVWNEYGPTETVVGCCVYDVPAGALPDRVPIGGPIANTVLRVLDPSFALTPGGVPGELYIGGVGVARGYVGQPALTADRFRPDPFSETPGARLYKTGDIVRLRGDGLLDFLGRNDDQVKIRGYRIELAEIEHALSRHPAVEACAVVAEHETMRLVGYAALNQSCSTAALIEFLRNALPAYMVPDTLEIVGTIPLTSHGKVDRRALTRNAAPRLPSGSTPAGLTPTQEIVAGLWSDILKVPVAGADDHFFHLGGHSLMATRAVARLRAAFGVALPLRCIFDRPTVRELAATIDHLLRAGADAPAMPLEQQTADLVPLSFAQQRLWFLDQLVKDHPYYNVPVAVRARGRLRRDALAYALTEIARRHAALRTVFVDVAAGEPRQRVLAPMPVELPMVDLTSVPAEAREAEATRLAIVEAQKPFDLRAGPLWRGALLRLGSDEHLILLTLHHIVCDGWSMGVLIGEIDALYRAYCDGRSSPLLPLPIQYTDYAWWQRQWLQGEVLERELRYWREQLAGAPLEIALPTDHPRPQAPSFKGERLTRVWPLALAGELRALSGREGATLFMTLLAGFQALLARYSGTTDICVGTPAANRTRVEVEGLIGFFVNTLVLRTDLSGNPTFRELLHRVRSVALGAYAHQDLPFERLVDELQPERRLGRNPLFQVNFALQNAPRPPLELPDLTLEPLDVDNGTTKFDLTLSVTELPHGLAVTLEYAVDLFSPSTAARMLTHLSTLLAAAAARPDTRLATLPLSSDEERAQLLRDGAGASVARASIGVHELIKRHAKTHPEDIALVCGADRLTFARLNSEINRLAHYLRCHGAGPERRVGLYFNRSPEMVVALLAVLEAGAAYVPLDPAYPTARLRAIVAQAGVDLVLADRVPDHGFLADHSDHPRLFVLGDHAERIGSMPDQGLDEAVEATELAYILFTSGSTGLPKGVMVTHGGLTNYVAWAATAYPMTAGRGAPVQSPLTFDLTVTSLLAPLATGRTVVLLPEEPDLHALSAITGMSLVKITPAHLQVLSATMPPSSVAEWTRSLVIGGEALTGDTLRFFRQHAPGMRVFNEYGPTETVVGCCVYDLPTGELPDRVPIGRPIANTVLRVLDDAHDLTPAGLAGELYIGGAGVARGYAGQPDLTADRFRPDPFSDTPGGRLYKSGDIVRLRGDGELEFLGRRDDQVKIRGYRIEPGEIEAALREHPAVGAAACVVPDEDGRYGKALIACVVPRKTFRSVAAEADRIARWQSIFDTTVHAGGVPADPTSNFAGWTSAYTGRAIPPDEMTEWVERTTARILELRPRRVLEIGSGTGLLLFRVAPHCERYYATDLSQEALAASRAVAISRAPAFDHVEFVEMAAHHAVRDAGEDLDCIILNSVVQYFPSADYLRDLLETAVGRLAPGGHVFIGDVRNLADLATLHASIAVYRADAAEPLANLRRQMEASARNEEELLLDPRFFSTLARSWPRVNGVLCRAKLGRAVNELTKFRYDVVMRVGDREAGRDPRFAGEAGTDDRTRFDREVARLLFEDADGGLPPVTVGDLRQRAEAAAIDTAKWTDRAAAMEQQDRILDPCLVAGQPAQLRLLSRGRHDPPPFFSPDDAVGDCRDYVNRPSLLSAVDGLVASVRESLAERLPTYMMPARIVVADRIPLTRNGKVDVAAVANLARTSDRATGRAASVTEPETGTERLMALVWADLLSVSDVSRDDDFFNRGGHSLLATQLVARIDEVFDSAITLRDVFEAPRLCDLCARVDRIRQERSGIAWPRLERVSRTGAAPLAFAQERLWMLQHMDPESTDFNVPLALHLEGEVVTQAIAGALKLLVDRHETLRTVFVEDDSGVSCRVLPTQEVVLEELAAGSLPDAIGLAAGHAHRRFDLVRGPLLRAALIHAGDRGHVLVITLHHLISDSWSLAVFIRELVIAYEALTRGAEPSLPPMPIQYGDFAAWQQRVLTSEALEHDLDYWRGCLSNLPPLMFQPRPIADPASLHPSVEHIELDAELVGALDAFSRREHASVFMVLLGALQFVLHEHTGCHDLLVATNVANRSKHEMQSLIGFLANQVMVRANVSETQTFCGLVAHVRRWILDAYAHEWTPFHLVQAAVQPERHGVTSVLTQVKFNYHEIGEAPNVPGVHVSPVTIPFQRTRAEALLWQVVRTGTTMRIEAEADGRHLTATELSALLRHFVLALDHALLQPHVTVAALTELVRANRREEQTNAHNERRRRLGASLASAIQP